MFNNLDEQIENVQGEGPTSAERWIRRLVIFATSLILFIALLLVIGLVEY